MKKEPTIVHVLADGKRVKSVEGSIVPADNAAYAILIAHVRKQGATEQCKKQAC